MDSLGGLWGSLPFALLLFLGAAFITAPSALAWSKEGHMMTCQIAQVKFNFIALQLYSTNKYIN